MIVLSFSSLYLLPSYWYIWAAFAVGGLLALVSRHAKSTAYKCSMCGYEFEISVLKDFFSPHGVKGGGWMYLKCPKCSNRSRMRILVKSKQEAAT